MIRAVPAARNRSIVVPLAGATLVLIYILLSGIQPYQSTAGRNFHFISPDELRFWLAHWMLATPGIMLIAVDQGSHTFRYVWRRLLSLPSRQWHLVGLCYFGALAGLAVAGRSVFLLNLPITDDENTVLFGAQMWLNGELSVPILEPDGAFTQAFTYRHAGRTSAMAFPGDILFRAVSLATGLGTALYAPGRRRDRAGRCGRGSPPSRAEGSHRRGVPLGLLADGILAEHDDTLASRVSVLLGSGGLALPASHGEAVSRCTRGRALGLGRWNGFSHADT